MPKPEWNRIQHPELKSPEHGKVKPHPHGLGAQRDPKHEKPPKQAPDDVSIIEPEEGEPEATVSAITGLTVYPAGHTIPNVPPVTDQGSTPMCVAYASGYDQNQHDRPEMGKFENFDEPKFFYSIGGGRNGAFMSNALARRVSYGYPEQDSTPSPGSHRIAGYTQIPLTVAGIKGAILLGHGVLFIGDWFNSWFYPRHSGTVAILPAPDYVVGGHAIWSYQFDDRYGFRLHNSWGTDWANGGNVSMPYAFLSRMYAAYRTTDK